jgi:cold shock protein
MIAILLGMRQQSGVSFCFDDLRAVIRGFLQDLWGRQLHRAAPSCGTTQRDYGGHHGDRFNSQKGYGFIQPDSGGKDVFVHISAVERAGLGSLNEGQKVKYEVLADRGKESAGNLQLVGWAVGALSSEALQWRSVGG